MKKIRKYMEFITEMNDTPESYVSVVLSQLKRKIDEMFDFQEEGEESSEPQQTEKSKSFNQAKSDHKDKSKINFKDLGITLNSSEISKYSKMYDSLTVKFSDDNATYNLFIAIDLKEAIPKDPSQTFDSDDIKKCYIKFKKYDKDKISEVLGQLTDNVDIDKIDEQFLIDLKIKMDEKFGGDEEKIEFET